jgi:hypothetical protein
LVFGVRLFSIRIFSNSSASFGAVISFIYKVSKRQFLTRDFRNPQIQKIQLNSPVNVTRLYRRKFVPTFFFIKSSVSNLNVSFFNVLVVVVIDVVVEVGRMG